MAGYLEFQTGQVLTAAQVNTLLMEQSTMTFADAAARDAALAGVLREGLLTYNLDTNRLEVYDGTDWVEPAPEPPAGIGSNVVQAVKKNQQSTTSDTFQDVIGLSVTITPSSVGSKILLMATVNTSTGPNTATESCEVRFTGGNSNDYNSTDSWSVVGGTSTTIGFFPANGFGAHTSVGIYLDAPAVTSPVTYKVQFRRAANGTAFINRARGKSVSSSLTVIEVAP